MEAKEGEGEGKEGRREKGRGGGGEIGRKEERKGGRRQGGRERKKGARESGGECWCQFTLKALEPQRDMAERKAPLRPGNSFMSSSSSLVTAPRASDGARRLHVCACVH